MIDALFWWTGAIAWGVFLGAVGMIAGGDAWDRWKRHCQSKRINAQLREIAHAPERDQPDYTPRWPNVSGEARCGEAWREYHSL